MLKGIDSQTGAPVISVAQQWCDCVDQLRARCHADTVLCPECRQPVILRAGHDRIWHFAHRTRSNCPLKRETEEVLAARVMLYELLQRAFGDRVALEERIPGAQRAESADCVVTLHTGKIAYFIVAKQIRKRSEFLAFRRQAYSAVHWILLPRLLQVAPDSANGVLLSPTACDLASRDGIERIYGGHRRIKEGSLYCADVERDLFVIARGLHIVHVPNVYHASAKLELSPQDVVVDSKTGELMAVEEGALLADWQREQEEEATRQREYEAREIENRRRREARQREHEAQEKEEFLKKAAEVEEMKQAEKRRLQNIPSTGHPETVPAEHATGSVSDSEEPRMISGKTALTCLRCERTFTEWSYTHYDGCVCKPCAALVRETARVKEVIESPKSPHEEGEPSYKKELPCLHCGKKTRHWSIFAYHAGRGADVCLCNDCHESGLAFPFEPGA